MSKDNLVLIHLWDKILDSKSISFLISKKLKLFLYKKNSYHDRNNSLNLSSVKPYFRYIFILDLLL